MRPGKGGLVVGLRHLPALAEALAAALATAREKAASRLNRPQRARNALDGHCAAPPAPSLARLRNPNFRDPYGEGDKSPRPAARADLCALATYPAWRALSLASRALLVEILMEYRPG